MEGEEELLEEVAATEEVDPEMETETELVEDPPPNDLILIPPPPNEFRNELLLLWFLLLLGITCLPVG